MAKPDRNKPSIIKYPNGYLARVKNKRITACLQEDKVSYSFEFVRTLTEEEQLHFKDNPEPNDGNRMIINNKLLVTHLPITLESLTMLNAITEFILEDQATSVIIKK